MPPGDGAFERCRRRFFEELAGLQMRPIMLEVNSREMS